jgi:hypothetical protein
MHQKIAIQANMMMYMLRVWRLPFSYTICIWLNVKFSTRCVTTSPAVLHHCGVSACTASDCGSLACTAPLASRRCAGRIQVSFWCSHRATYTSASSTGTCAHGEEQESPHLPNLSTGSFELASPFALSPEAAAGQQLSIQEGQGVSG